MTKTAEQVLQLDSAERLDLVHRLLDSTETDGVISSDPEINAAWEAEIARRVEAHDRGETTGIPWEQVRAAGEQAREGRVERVSRPSLDH